MLLHSSLSPNSARKHDVDDVHRSQEYQAAGCWLLSTAADIESVTTLVITIARDGIHDVYITFRRRAAAAPGRRVDFCAVVCISWV